MSIYITGPYSLQWNPLRTQHLSTACHLDTDLVKDMDLYCDRKLEIIALVFVAKPFGVTFWDSGKIARKTDDLVSTLEK